MSSTRGSADAALDRPGQHARPGRGAGHTRRYAYLLLAPALVGLAVFRVYPMLVSLWESLHTQGFAVGGGQRDFVGLANYIDLVRDPVFLTSMRVTLVFNLVVNPVILAVALMLAVIANQKVRGATVYRSFFLLPVGVSVTIAAVLWRMMLDPSSGFINGALGLIGVEAQPFLTSSSQALYAIVMIVVWSSAGFWMLFFLAGLQNISPEVLEAAVMDGATTVQRFFRVTLPMLRRVMLFVLVVNTTTNFLVFSPMYVLTSGGPELSTNSVMYEAYRTGFVFVDMGRALAMVVILLLLLGIFVVVQFRAFGERD